MAITTAGTPKNSERGKNSVQMIVMVTAKATKLCAEGYSGFILNAAAGGIISPLAGWFSSGPVEAR